MQVLTVSMPLAPRPINTDQLTVPPRHMYVLAHCHSESTAATANTRPYCQSRRESTARGTARRPRCSTEHFWRTRLLYNHCNRVTLRQSNRSMLQFRQPAQATRIRRRVYAARDLLVHVGRPRYAGLPFQSVFPFADHDIRHTHCRQKKLGLLTIIQ
jgi:hypothetical protein